MSPSLVKDAHSLQKTIYYNNVARELAKCISRAAENLSHGLTSVKLETKPTKEESCVVVSKPPPDVRLVLFRECKETSNRNILFDSNSIEKVDDPKTNKFCNGQVPQHNVPKARYQVVNAPKDWGMLAEMLFGTVGMACRNSSLKIHLMKDPPRLMLSRVYADTTTKDNSASLERGIDYLRPNSLSSRRAKTLPVATPDTPTQQLPSPTVASSLTSSLTRLTRSDSSTSLLSMFGSLGTPVMRGNSPAQPIAPRSHSLPQSARHSTSRDTFTLSDELNGIPKRKAKIKIGFAVVMTPEPSCNKDFQKFVFSHFPIIESHMTKLKEDVEIALNFRRSKQPNYDFIYEMMFALEHFTRHLTGLYCTPRLIEPMWRTLTAKSDLPWRSDRSTIECLIADITTLFRGNNKNNFMSSLISAVLTHHLGWVSSVTPSTDEEIENRQMINYNPLWAQLADMYGATCSPTRVSKTVVTGENHQRVSTIVSVLSYFIRCINVDEAIKTPNLLDPQNVMNYDDCLEMHDLNGGDKDDFLFVTQVDPLSSMTSSVMTNNFSETKNSESLSHTDKIKKQSTNLHRSRSSPFADSRLCSRHRTSSTDTLSRSRFVQSRRKSHISTDPEIFTKLSAAISIPSMPSLKADVKEGISFPDDEILKMNKMNLENSNECVNCNKDKNKKTHKRVNSEPFKIHATQMPLSESNDSSPKIRCQQTFVEKIEPKIETVTHVQSTASLAPCRIMKENLPPEKICKGSDFNANNIEKRNIVRRESSERSKRIAARRRKLDRTPSVQLKHDEFIEYFSDGEDTPISPISETLINTPAKEVELLENKPKIMDVVKVETPKKTVKPPHRPAPPLPSRPPVHNGKLYPDLPPPLPATPPVGKSINLPISKSIYPKFSPLIQDSAKPSRPTSLYPDLSNNSVHPVQKSDVKKMYPDLPSLSSPIPLQPVNFHIEENEEQGETIRQKLPLTEINFSSKCEYNVNFGYGNLMVDYTPKYMWNFALHGTIPQPDLPSQIVDELDHAVKRPVLDEIIAESVCIHADSDRGSVSVYSSHRLRSGQVALPALSSKLVYCMLERVAKLYTLKVPADFCLMQLESELTQLVLKSRMLAEYVRGQNRVTVADLSKVLGIENYDLPLLMAIASCYSPQVGAVMP